MNIPRQTNGATIGLRAYARHADLSPSYVHRLIADGVIRRDAAGRIDTVQADAALAELRGAAHPGRLAANAERRQQLRAAKDDGPLIDVEVSDEALRWQPLRNAERDESTPTGQILGAWEMQMGVEQAAILQRTFTQLRTLAGESAAHSRILGELFGRLRHLIDLECDELDRRIAARLDDAQRGRQ